MIIKIKQCSYKKKEDLEYWYKDLIGKMFDVLWSNEWYHFVRFDKGKKANFINVLDVE